MQILFKDFPGRTTSDIVLHDKAFNIAENPTFDGYQRGLARLLLVVVLSRKPIIRKFEKQKVHSSFIENILVADLDDMHLLSKFNKGICFLLFVTDIFSKCAWFVPLKDKRVVTITNAFQKILNESGLKPNKIWVDKSSKFYSRSMKSYLQGND